MPALATVRRTLTTDLKSGDRSVSRASRTLYHALVAGEVALAGALLVLSILLVRTVQQMTEVPTGVGKPGVMTASVQLSGRPNTDWAGVAAVKVSLPLSALTLAVSPAATPRRVAAVKLGVAVAVRS